MKTAPQSPILLIAIDDNEQALELVRSALEQEGLEVFTSSNPEEGLALVLRKRPQIVLLDLVMPQVNGMELLERIVEADPGIDVVLMTAHYSTESAVEAIQKGACDYMNKPFTVQELRERVGRLIADARRRGRSLELERELLEAYQFEGIVGRSPAMLDVFSRIRRVALHFRTVLVTGPTGTGKELVAQALHKLSPASSGPFAVCNCSAIVETLFESELFGHVKGAFTGATQDKMGLFEAAHNGTLFLDEIGDMPVSTQAKLLRVLQNQEVQRVGSLGARKVDVRVIAATNRTLASMVAAKEFRQDLYYRLAMVEIKLPSLADRKEDLPLLVRHLVDRFAAEYKKPLRGLTRRAQTLLSRYSWPGNVRELENVIGNACMMAQGEVVDVEDLPEQFRQQASELEGEGALLSLEDVERRHVRQVLAHLGGNKVRAAEVLGISRATLYRILAEAEPHQGGDEDGRSQRHSAKTS